jgi:adenylate cyclase
MLGRTEEATEAEREGIQRAESALDLNPLDGRARSLELYPDDLGTLINAACLRAKAGLKKEALDFLERVFAKGWGKRDWIEHDPDYDTLRDDPRFKKLLANLK